MRCYRLSREDNLSQVLYTVKRRQLKSGVIYCQEKTTHFSKVEYDNLLDQLLLFGIENTLKLLHILHRLFVCCCNIIVIFISHKPYTTVQRRHTYTIRMLVLGPTEPFNTFIQQYREDILIQ